MSDELTREQLDRLAAYAAAREAEWSRDMDCEQALCEPDDRCTVTIWELQGLIGEARRAVPGLVQYNALVSERNAARAHARAWKRLAKRYRGYVAELFSVTRLANQDIARTEDERDAAQTDLEIARDRIKDAEQIIDTVRRCTVTIGGVVLKGLLDAYGKKWGTQAWARYEERYRQEMLASYRLNRAAWDELLARECVTLTCFCVSPGTCHRRLLAGYLGQLGAVVHGERTAEEQRRLIA